tara:strand:- start:506 stop:1327 length:822 start_codon:yes stop_codon:yes gene_type:complete
MSLHFSKYFQAEVKPGFNTGASIGTAFSDNDILFDWKEFHLPKGVCRISNISGTIMGTNSAAGNSHDMILYFARTIDGFGPSPFRTAHSAMTAFFATKLRPYLLGAINLDESLITDGDHLIAYSVFNSNGQMGGRNFQPSVMLANSDGVVWNGELIDGSVVQDTSAPLGYDTFFVAAIANGAFDFGTDVDLNQPGHQAASTDPVQITTSGTDPRDVFAPGDVLITEGSNARTADVVSVDSATTMTIKNISGIIDHQEQLVHLNPIVLNIGVEY